MRKNTLIIALSLVFYFIFGETDIYAQQNNDGKKLNVPDYEHWAEGQIKHWEDSVMNALYPQTITGKAANSGIMRANSVQNAPTAVPSSFTNSYVKDSYSIDKNKAVGEIPISSSISSTGSVNYSVPVEIYPGINGFQPQLSIVYNNQAGDGVIGVGWGLSGLSSISRIGQSIYYDKKSQGVVMTKNDPFTLDGQRLIKLSETATQIKYETEQGYIKVNAVLNGDIIRYFEVYYPNGSKAVYGNNSNNTYNYLTYPVTSFSDMRGNTISYSYSYSNNRYIVNKITYNGASIEFSYINRSYPTIAYNGGLKITEDKLLQKIVCKFGSTILRTYNFTFQIKQYNYLLTQIDCNAGNSSLNPLRFFYGEGNTANVFTNNETQLYEWYVNAQHGQLRVSKGKFDYGTDDDGLVSLPNKNSYWQHYRNSTMFRHSQNRFDNYYSGTEKIFFYAGLNTNFASPMPTIQTENGFTDLFCANVDGKYEEEVIKVNNYVSGSNDCLIFKVYTPNLYTGLGLKYTRTFNFSTVLEDADGGKSIHPKFHFTGDFNGNGKMEVFSVSCHNPFGWTDKRSKCYLFDLDTNSKLYEGYNFEYKVDFVGSRQGDGEAAAQNTDRLFVLDYDGDGKSDICLINNTGTYIYTFDISGSTYSIRQIAFYSGLKKADLAGREMLIGEFNGDGKPDLLISPKINANDWSVFYSMGNGQFEKYPIYASYKYKNDKYLIQDVNADGLTDLVKYDSNGFTTYLKNNYGFSYNNYIKFEYTDAFLVPTNINSRNYFHQLVALKDGKVTRFSFSRNDTKEKLLTGVVNSLGVVDKNYYQMLNESGCYSKGYGAVFPFENFQGPLFVPVSTEQYVNGQRKEDNTYYYENAVIHKQGLGFRGFNRIITYDNIRRRTMTQEYDPFNFGILKSEESPWVKNTNTYNVNVQSNKIVRITMSSHSSLNKLKNTTITSTYQCDAYGNPTSESINYGGGISGTVTRKYHNNVNESGYILGYLIDMTKTTNRNGSTWSERMHIPVFSYGSPTVKIQYSNGNQVAYEVFTYNSQGCVTKKTVRNYSASTILGTNYEYDSYGRLTKETDPMNFNTTFEYNTNGTLKNQKNNKEQATVYDYDSFGRLISTSYPDGMVKSTSFSWVGAGTGGLYCTTTTIRGEPTRKVYRDALNRETRSSVMKFNGVEGHTDKLYDSYGRLQKVSLPFTGSSASLWDEYSYDSYDRSTSINEASGKKTTYSYSGSNVTTTKEGVTSTQSFDTQGNLISVTDPAGRITYNLRPDGQPSIIIAPGNVTTSFGYDVYGRRTRITDSSAGTQYYQYDDAGNLKQETDANNNSIDFAYDNYNRLTHKTSPEFSTTYTYNSDGLLATVSSTNGTSGTYTYNTYGRLRTAKESSVDGKWLIKNYSYYYNNIAAIEYISQTGRIGTEIYSYSNGALTEIKLNGSTSIWKLNSENDLGQPTSVTTGNFNRSYGYDAYGLPTYRKAGTFQNFSYEFDVAKGNLTYRKDNSAGIREDFSYDNLNRLTGYNSYLASYDFKGNITQKTDVGNTFYYETPGKPYAVSSISTTNNAIPLRNQTITYNSFKRPNTIVEGDYNSSFVYNDDGSRVKMELKKNNTIELRRYYLGSQYELDEGIGGTKEKLYLGGDYYSAAAVYVKENSGNWQIYYICRDYLGSITHITNSSGAVVQQLSYDAWGRLRNPSNQTVYSPDNEPTLFLGRGYTGHEHLTMFGIINMNARLYDPAVGRFLSADPYVQAPDFSQSFNRYSYAMNNPLKYIDPNGEFWHIIIGAVIGGFANVIYKACTGQLHSWQDGFVAFGIGAAAGAIGAATGGVAFAAAGGAAGGAGGFLAGAAAGAASSAVMTPVQSVGNHLYFGDPLISAKEYFMGIGIGALAGGSINGATAAIKGNNFWTGKDIAFGRSTFSFNNTPTKVAPEMSEMPGKAISVDAAPAAKQPLTNDELVQKAAEKADNAIEGSGRFAGTAKHEYANDLLDRYQDVYGDRGFKLKPSINHQEYGRSILDVLDTKNKIIYDFKFGYPKMTETKFLLTPQMIKYQNTYPGHTIRIIHIHF